MDNTNRVLTAMQPCCIYRPCDLVDDTNLTVDAVRDSLKRLARGMIVEEIKTGEYRRKSLYQTKQEKLFK
jgi:hypothetical protein